MNTECKIDVLSAQLTFLGDFLALWSALSKEQGIEIIENGILVLADWILLDAAQTGNEEFVELGNILTVFGDLITAVAE